MNLAPILPGPERRLSAREMREQTRRAQADADKARLEEKLARRMFREAIVAQRFAVRTFNRFPLRHRIVMAAQLIFGAIPEPTEPQEPVAMEEGR